MVAFWVDAAVTVWATGTRLTRYTCGSPWKEKVVSSVLESRLGAGVTGRRLTWYTNGSPSKENVASAAVGGAVTATVGGGVTAIVGEGVVLGREVLLAPRFLKFA